MSAIDNSKEIGADRSQTVQIFISHRFEDSEIATKLKSKLQNHLAKDKVVVHVCEDTQGEKSWKDWIEEKIAASQILIFLYTVEHEEAWRWCMYEIGLFNGLRAAHKERKLVCLKNPHLEQLPSPLSDVTPYVADEAGLRSFLHQLLRTNTHTGKTLVESPQTDWDVFFDQAVVDIDRAFVQTRLFKKFYNQRITIDLKTDRNMEIRTRVENSVISGESQTMRILMAHSTESDWKHVYENFRRIDQATWLNQLMTVAENLASDREPPRILHPFVIKGDHGREWYLPVVSATEMLHPPVPQEEPTPTKINVIFLPQLLSQEGLLQTLPTLIPFCKVKFWLDGDTEDGTKKLAEDENGKEREPQVTEMNRFCLRLYNISRTVFEEENISWTSRMLLERLKRNNFVREEDVNKLYSDQGRVIRELLLEGFPNSEAWIPLRLTELHSSYPNECFLPCIVSSQPQGDTTREHFVYVLVAYVKEFWPPDDDKNPFNKGQTQSKKLPYALPCSQEPAGGE